ncbi:MAG: right-handed parallel beta-helix repeat-containing protein [Verrucomicrobia bacterium]|nr:right-handed parallel beta-helix repeat-containing protein [Verrucomicrobiota bacterium]
MKSVVWRMDALGLAGAVVIAAAARSAEFHVATGGSDAGPGTAAAPLRTVQRAADLAQPGDTVTVHAGLYRERVNPPRGGESDARRIVYRAAPGEAVEIRGSEAVTNWAQVRDGVWNTTLPNSFFGGFNPYSDRIRGDWFTPKGREHHTGAVYLDGTWLDEAAALDDVMAPGSTNETWFALVDGTNTTIWVRSRGAAPGARQAEINVRQTVFYPDKPGRNFITVRGFALRHAATPWAPPTAEQPGLIGTHWSRGWIIESNDISHSRCVGVALGKHGDSFDNTSANSAEGYVKTLERAHAHAIPWTRENIGHHVVRDNTISHCEQAGIVGSLGAAFSRISGNVIHDIHVRKLFTGAEMAGIKIHASIDCEIAGNRIFRTCRGLWMDWMAQGTRITRNLCYENASEDLFMEVDHGPYLVDNNIFLSPTGLLDISQGGAFVHNLWTGKLISAEELRRETPYHPAHSTVVAGLSTIQGGDNRFFNNIFIGAGDAPVASAKKDDRHARAAGYGTWMYDVREHPSVAAGNVYLNGARPLATEEGAVVAPGVDPRLRLVEKGGSAVLQFAASPEMKQAATKRVTTDLLGKAAVPQLPFVNPDGTPLGVDADYFGKRRASDRPSAGPFESPGTGPLSLEVGRP